MNFGSLFSRVNTVEAGQAKEWLATRSPDDHTLLDVRQPEEYAAGHVPGAQLVPLDQLEGRLDELPRDKPIMVY